MKYEIRVPDVERRADYPALLKSLARMPVEEAHEICRHLARTDLFFLLVYGCKRADADNDWCFARCREVQAEPNGCLDLWSRGHYKSSIITFALTIQDIISDPELTFGIFSHTRPIAKAFLRQIKTELETNERLKAWFPEIFWSNPRKEALKWSEDEGITVKRSGNPKEATIEAWGLVDGQPTSKHYKVLLYDDVVTRESVTTPEQIQKVNDAWALSLNLGVTDGLRRYAGTTYALGDTYALIRERKSAKVREYPATVDGTVHGEPVFLTRQALMKKREDMGPYIFSAQMLMNPIADSVQGFKLEWLRYYGRETGKGMVKALLVDPAGEKKKGSDYTVMAVLGLAADGNIYLLDGIRDRLNLSQRANLLINMHRMWKPGKVGYEKYGKDSDIEAIGMMMEQQQYRFAITPLGGQMAKPDRIRRLVPYFEQSRVWLPDRLDKIDYENKPYDFVERFVKNEYSAFPACLHDDMLDDISRIFDLFPGGLPFPRGMDEISEGRSGYASADYDEFA
jgi:phage terminase large subunit-like protein